MEKILFILLMSPLAVWAQKPLSATLTNPHSQTFKVPDKPNLPLRNLPCMMANGVDVRPFACEFSFDKLEILDKSGTVLATVTRQKSSVSLAQKEAKKEAVVNGMNMVTYVAKAYFTRINPPAFFVKNGYLIERSSGAAGTTGDFINTLLTGIAIDPKVGTKKTVAFDLTWPHNADGTALFQVHLENDVTTNKLKPKPGTVLAMRDKAEASMIVNPKLVKP